MMPVSDYFFEDTLEWVMNTRAFLDAFPNLCRENARAVHEASGDLMQCLCISVLQEEGRKKEHALYMSLNALDIMARNLQMLQNDEEGGISSYLVDDVRTLRTYVQEMIAAMATVSE